MTPVTRQERQSARSAVAPRNRSEGHRRGRELRGLHARSALPLLTAAAVAAFGLPASGGELECERSARQGAQRPAASANFVLEWSPGVQADPEFFERLLKFCEERRAELVRQWHRAQRVPPWRPRCTIVLHPHRAAYAARLGLDVGDSVGCATIRRRHGRIIERRLDLHVDAPDWQIDALPHELTHLVLWDLVAPEELPPWAAEGIAALSESPAKRSRRLAALQTIPDWLRYDLDELLCVQSLPPPERRTAFYSQSLQLVQRLVRTHGRAALAAAIAHADRRALARLLAPPSSVPARGHSPTWSAARTVASAQP